MVTVATLTGVINHLLPEPHAGLLSGILFGTKATLNKDLTEALVATGTLHIVALSGTNITILTGLVDQTLLFLLNRRLASLLTVVLIFGFVWFVGPSASLIRAAIMGTISLLAIVFGRQTWGLLSWLLAVSLMLLLNPGWIADLSFQLSALATLGIILFGAKPAPKSHLSSSLLSDLGDLGHLRKVLVFLWSLVVDDLRLTLSAQVFTIPLIFFHFHRLSFVSPLSNLLIGWMIPPLTLLGLFTVITGFIFLPLGQVFAWFTWVPLQYLLKVVELTSKIPGASWGW